MATTGAKILKPLETVIHNDCLHCRNINHTNFDCPCDCHRKKITSLIGQKITNIKFNSQRNQFEVLNSKKEIIAIIDCNTIYDGEGFCFHNDLE